MCRCSTPIPGRSTSSNDLAALRGPTEGIHRLPLHLDWGPAADYDLGNPVRVRTIYSTVLREAGSEADLETHLDRAILRATWADLNLPAHIRDAWEVTHPQLGDL